MHGRNPSIYLFGENDSIQAFHVKPGVIWNILVLNWFNSEIFTSNILFLNDVTQIHIFIFNVFDSYNILPSNEGIPNA